MQSVAFNLLPTFITCFTLLIGSANQARTMFRTNKCRGCMETKERPPDLVSSRGSLSLMGTEGLFFNQKLIIFKSLRPLYFVPFISHNKITTNYIWEYLILIDLGQAH